MLEAKLTAAGESAQYHYMNDAGLGARNLPRIWCWKFRKAEAQPHQVRPIESVYESNAWRMER